MKMPEYLNQPTIWGVIFTVAATILLLWGSHINSTKSTTQIIDNSNSNKEEIIGVFIQKSQQIFENIISDNFTNALALFNFGNLEIRKGVILELKNKAISDITQRQKIVNFICSLNDWITEKEQFKEVLLKPDIEWTKWKMNKEYLQLDGKIFEKEKQIISIEASNAIDEIIFEHIKRPTPIRLNFHKKNLLGLLFSDYDFIYRNIDFSQAKLFGAYFRDTKNINQTNFIYAKFYGRTLFQNMILPETIYVNHDLGTEYNGDVHFRFVQFPQGLNLTNSYFRESVHFLTCEFQDNALFYLSKFNKEVSFFRCIFIKEAGFNSVTFKEKSSFTNSTFLGKTQFVTVHFKDEANFKAATFKSKPNFSKTVMDNVINLK